LRWAWFGEKIPRMREGQSKEVAIAGTRVLLAASSFVAIHVDPTEPSRFATIASVLLGLYLVHSLAALASILWMESDHAIPYFYGVDIAWPAFISAFTNGASTPFFLFFFFALVSCGYRWGMKRSLQTASFFVVVFLVEGFANNRMDLRKYFYLSSDVSRMFVRSIYLMIMGFLIGFLAEEERALREKMDTSLRLLHHVNAESGLLASVAAALTFMGDTLGAKYVVCFCQRKRSAKAMLFVLSTEFRNLTTLQLHENEIPHYSSLEDEVFVLKKRGTKSRLGVPTAKPFRRFAWRQVTLPPRYGGYVYSSAISCNFDFGEFWYGRVLVLDPSRPTSVRKLNLLKYVIRQTLPSIYNVYLLEQLRERASQIERSRLARALHDSTLQALSGIRMQLEAMRLATRFPVPQVRQIIHIEQLLREQAVELRALMMGRDLDSFDAESLPRKMQDVVRKIAREGDLNAQFVWDGKPVQLSNLKCRELVLAAQEGMANVVKHSHAKNVAVVLKSEGSSCIMTIVDDGQGFPVEGTFSLAELDEASWGPLVVKERARTMGADLQLQSKPGGGTTIEISVRQEKMQDV
jgi:signal transduction histidine kinase